MSILEDIYFITGGPVLAIIAGIGLYQLKIVKDAARMNAKREAYKLASEQCSYYLANVIPAANNLNEKIRQHKIALYTESVVTVEGETVRVNYNGTQSKYEAAVTEPEFSTMANSMEGFAVMFVSRVADESIGFSAVGRTYCQSVKDLLPELMLLKGGKEYYINLFKLFFLWNSRLEAMRLQEEKESIEARQAKINNKKISPLGTD